MDDNAKLTAILCAHSTKDNRLAMKGDILWDLQ